MARGTRREPEYKRWYKTSRWQKLRAAFLAKHPVCVMCEAEGKTTKATVCDHIEPHRGDAAKFWSGPYQALCQTHHSSDKQRMEKGGKPKPRTGLDGWPVDCD